MSRLLTVDLDDPAQLELLVETIDPGASAEVSRRWLEAMLTTHPELLTDRAGLALDAVEARIREQAGPTDIMSMVWRAHMADVAHVSAVRIELESGPPDDDVVEKASPSSAPG